MKKNAHVKSGYSFVVYIFSHLRILILAEIILKVSQNIFSFFFHKLSDFFKNFVKFLCFEGNPCY